MWRAFLPLFISLVALGAEDAHVTLAIGSPAPAFSLPGVDGKTHKLADYADSPILAIVFTCTLSMSWALTVLLRKIPVVARTI